MRKYELNALYVEDDETLRNLSKETLQGAFNNFYTAVDGEEGLELFKSKRVDLVITDIKMPKKDGLSLCREIKEISPETKVIIISAYSDTQNLQKAVESRADKFLMKPVRLQEMFQAVSQIEREIDLQQQHNRHYEQSRKYEYILNSSHEFMTLVNSDYIYEAVNKAYCDAHEKNPEDFIGKSAAEVWGEKRFQLFIKEHFDRCFSGELVQYSKWFDFGKLGKRFFKVSYYPTEEQPDGSFRYATVVSVDFTEEKRAEEELNRLSLAVEQSLAAIIETNTDGKIIYVNNMFEKVSGYKKSEVLGKTPAFLGKKEENSKHYEALWDTITRGDAWEGEFCDIRKDGSEFWVRAWISPVRGVEGGIKSFIAVEEDITEQKRISEKRRQEYEYKQKAISEAQRLQKTLNTTTTDVVSGTFIQPYYMPSEELGGDMFVLKHDTDERYSVILADATGHGLKASMSATLLKSVCDNYSWLLSEKFSPSAFMELVNRTMCEYVIPGEYPALLAAVYDRSTKKLRYTNAGFRLPYIFEDNKIFMLKKTEGTLVGLMPSTVYSEEEISLFEDQCVVFYSDAMVELINKSGDVLELHEIEKILSSVYAKSKNMRDFVNKLLAEYKEITGSLPLDDDLTMVFLQTKLAGRQRYEVTSLESLNKIADELFELLMLYNYERNDAEQGRCAFNELAENAFRHGNQNDETKNVKVSLHIDFNGYEFSIEDEGKGFDPDDYENIEEVVNAYVESDDETLKTPSGFGLFVSAAYADNLVYSVEGKKVEFIKRRDRISSVFIDKGDF